MVATGVWDRPHCGKGGQRSSSVLRTPETPLVVAETGTAEGMLKGSLLKFIWCFSEAFPSLFSFAVCLHPNPPDSGDFLLNYVTVLKRDDSSTVSRMPTKGSTHIIHSFVICYCILSFDFFLRAGISGWPWIWYIAAGDLEFLIL